MERQRHFRYVIAMFLCINFVAVQVTVYNLSKYVPILNEDRDGWCVVASLIESKLSSAITECALWCFGQPHCTAFNLFDNGTCQLIDLPDCVKTLRIAGCKAYVIEGRKSEYYTGSAGSIGPTCPSGSLSSMGDIGPLEIPGTPGSPADPSELSGQPVSSGLLSSLNPCGPPGSIGSPGPSAPSNNAGDPGQPGNRETCYNSSWILRNQSCYFVSEFTADETTALKVCHEMNSILVSISNEDENNFVSSIATAKSHYDYWIGLYKCTCTKKATTYWLDYNTAVYRNWAGGDPDESECCVRMVAGGQWRDHPCSNLYRFICKSTVF